MRALLTHLTLLVFHKQVPLSDSTAMNGQQKKHIQHNHFTDFFGQKHQYNYFLEHCLYYYILDCELVEDPTCNIQFIQSGQLKGMR